MNILQSENILGIMYGRFINVMNPQTIITFYVLPLSYGFNGGRIGPHWFAAHKDSDFIFSYEHI